MSKRKAISSAVVDTVSQANLHDKLMILKWHHENGEKQIKTVHHFNANGFPTLTQSISKWLSKEAELQERLTSGINPSFKRFREAKNPQFDKSLSLWVDQMESGKFNGLTGDAIREAARNVYDKLGVPEEQRLKLSNGWLESFKARNRCRYSSTVSVNTTDVKPTEQQAAAEPPIKEEAEEPPPIKKEAE